jgi:hypothetical protein
MEEIRKLLNQAATIAEEKDIPFIAAFGVDKITMFDFTPKNAPERLKRTKTTLMMGAQHIRRQAEIQD